MRGQNYLNLPQVDQQVQRFKRNEFAMQEAQKASQRTDQEWDDEQRLKNTRWMAGASKVGMDTYDNDPQNFLPAMRELTKEGVRRGLLQPGQFNLDNPTPEEQAAMRQGLEQFLDKALIGIADGDQAERKIIKGADGYNYYQDDQSRVLPGVEKPESGGFGTTGSLQELNAINADREAQGLPPMPAEEFLTQRRQTSSALQQYNNYLSSVSPGETPMSESEYAATRAGKIKGSQTQAADEAGYRSTIISQGTEVADTVPVLRRNLELLKVVNTGGKISEWGLATLKAFGLESADQGELSAGLGKAVLGQLRETFGAQFTQEEGNRLAAIEAGFGKNNETNERLLGQALAIAEAKVKRAIKVARDDGNEVAAQIMEDMLQLELPGSDEESGGAAPEGTIIRSRTGQQVIKQNGRWVPLGAGEN